MILDYTSLRAAIANWLARADLSSAIPEFIQLAEARINRSLYVRERETSVTGTSAAGAIPIPADYDRMIALRVPVGGQMRALDAQPVMQDRDGQGVPYSYSVRDSEFRLCGVDDTDYTPQLQAFVETTRADELIVASAMLMRSEGGPRLLGYPALALLLFVVAVVLSLGIVISALLRDRKARPAERRGAG